MTELRIATLWCRLIGHVCIKQVPKFYPMAEGMDGRIGCWKMEPEPTEFCVRCGCLTAREALRMSMISGERIIPG